MPQPTEHRIRLHQAWELIPLCHLDGSAIELPESCRGAAGQSWNHWLGDFRGTVRYQRLFHPPTNLDADQVVELVIESIVGTATIKVNDACFDWKHADSRWPITSILKPNSKIQIDVTHPTSDGGITGAVWLAILAHRLVD